MKTTALLTGLATAVLYIGYRFFPESWLLSLIISCGTTCYHFSMRLWIGTLIPPVKKDHSWFRPKKWEAPVYRLLRVKAWKKHLPTYDPQQFSLEENTLEQVIHNMRHAEIVHEVIMVCSFLPLLAIPAFGAWPVFLITSILAALFDGLFVMAQRYNRPRLERILKKQEVAAP